MTLKDAQALAIKVLSKTLDMTKLTSEKGNSLLPLILESVNQTYLIKFVFSLKLLY